MLAVFHMSAFLIFGLALQSPRPTPTPTETRETHQYISRNEDQGSKPDKGVTVPNIAGSNQAAAQPKTESPEKEGNKHGSGPSANWWSTVRALLMIVFTGTLAVVAVLQWCSMQNQARYMEQTMRGTWKAADAATRNAEAFMNSERAWLMVSIKSTEGGVLGAAGNGCAEISFINYGKSPATITQAIIRVDRVPTIDDLDRLELADGTPLVGVENNVVGPIQPLKLPYYIPSEKLTPPSPSNQETIFLWGIVCYTDAYSRPWHTTFLYKSSPRTLPGTPILVEKVSHTRYNKHGKGDCSEGVANLLSRPSET